MKVIVAGSRSLSRLIHKENIIQNLSSYFKDNLPSEIISGKASGPDSYGEIWAEINNIPIKGFPADWKKYSKAAGHIRNKEMAIYADKAIIFYDGESKGTQNMIDEMNKLGKPYILYVMEK